MPGTNDFKAFATGGGANVLSPAAYAALTSLLANGFSSGVAPSQQLNTVWRQASFVAAAVAQLIADAGPNAVDDGNLAVFVANLKGAVGTPTSRIAAGAGTVDAITATFSPAPTAFVNGLPFLVRATGANTSTTPTFTPNSGTLAAKTIVKLNNQALIAGDISGAGHWMELQYDSVLDKFVLQNPADLPDIGRGQTWQAVTRVPGTTYYNTTGRPIMLSVYGSNGGTSCVGTISIDGGAALNFCASAIPTGTVIVAGNFLIPVGASYNIGGLTTITNAYELR